MHAPLPSCSSTSPIPPPTHTLQQILIRVACLCSHRLFPASVLARRSLHPFKQSVPHTHSNRFYSTPVQTDTLRSHSARRSPHPFKQNVPHTHFHTGRSPHLFKQVLCDLVVNVGRNRLPKGLRHLAQGDLACAPTCKTRVGHAVKLRMVQDQGWSWFTTRVGHGARLSSVMVRGKGWSWCTTRSVKVQERAGHGAKPA